MTILVEVGNWRIKRDNPEFARLYHRHKRERMDYSTTLKGTMRCHGCKAKPPAALRGLVMIANWKR